MRTQEAIAKDPNQRDIRECGHGEGNSPTSGQEQSQGQRTEGKDKGKAQGDRQSERCGNSIEQHDGSHRNSGDLGFQDQCVGWIGQHKSNRDLGPYFMCDITNVKTKPALFTSTIPNDERLIVDSSSVSLTGPRELAATMEMSELSRTWSLLSVLVEP